MKSKFESTSRRARTVAAVAAVVTVVALFDCVSTLGDTQPEALVRLQAGTQATRVASANSNGAQLALAQ
ncbi:MAG: hypothetical protein ABIS68_09705 [Casimicrobiaceae bacterium]